MDWLPELSDDDLATLLEALEAWERKDDAGTMFGDVVEMILGGDDPRMQQRVREARAADVRKRQQAVEVRKERSILLRAKLLTLRDRRRVERLTKEA